MRRTKLGALALGLTIALTPTMATATTETPPAPAAQDTATEAPRTDTAKGADSPGVPNGGADDVPADLPATQPPSDTPATSTAPTADDTEPNELPTPPTTGGDEPPATAEPTPSRDADPSPSTDLAEAPPTGGVPSTSPTAPAARARAQALAAPPAGAVTFDEFPQGTAVTTQYRNRGLEFGGTTPFITGDGSNPTSPVLSGTPQFTGSIEVRVVTPSGAATTARGVQLDVGYIDNRNSVEILYYGSGNALLGTVRTNALGINRVVIPVAGINRLLVRAVLDEPAGFAIDNVAINTSQPGPKVRRMVSLGDSYTSGEGIGEVGGKTYDCGTDMAPATYYTNSTIYRWALGQSSGTPCDTASRRTVSFGDVVRRGTTDYENVCHRHQLAWPNLLRTKLGVQGPDFLFPACSGAVTANIGLAGNTSQYPKSPTGVFGGRTQISDTRNFAAPPDRQSPTPQIPDLITIGIGGNDAKFVPVIERCVLRGIPAIAGITPCLNDQAFLSSTIANINGAVYSNLRTTYSKLREEFPNARILTYGYPSVAKRACDGRDGTPGLDQPTINWIANTYLPELNQAIADAAASAGVTFVDLTNLSAGHEVCSSNQWFKGLDIFSKRESFHPTKPFHEAVADFIGKRYFADGRMLFDNPAPNPTIRNPQTPITRVLGDIIATPQAQCGPLCVRPNCIPGSCAMQLNVRSLSPNTDLKATIYSTPRELGTLRTDSAGNISATFPVPADLPDGEHTIVVTGTDSDGADQQAFASVRLVREQPPADRCATDAPLPTGYALIVGTTGGDRLIGTPADELILGLGGNDYVDGGGGEDIVCGAINRHSGSTPTPDPDPEHGRDEDHHDHDHDHDGSQHDGGAGLPRTGGNGVLPMAAGLGLVWLGAAAAFATRRSRKAD